MAEISDLWGLLTAVNGGGGELTPAEMAKAIASVNPPDPKQSPRAALEAGGMIPPDPNNQRAAWDQILAESDALKRAAQNTTIVPRTDPPVALTGQTPGPEAFKSGPTTGGGELSGMDLSGGAMNRAITRNLQPVVGLGQFLAEGANKLGVPGAENAVKYVDDKRRVLDSAYEAQRANAGLAPDKIDWPGVAGEVSSLPYWLLGGAGAAAGRGVVPNALATRMIPATANTAARVVPSATALTAEGAGAGLASSVAQPVDKDKLGPDASYWTQKAKDAALGTAFGMAAPHAARAAGGVVGGIGDSLPDSVQTLFREGVRVPIGRALGGDKESSLLGRSLYAAESAGTSTPVVGMAIEHQTDNALNDLQRAFANRALRPIGETLPRNVAAGRDTNRYVRETLGSVYDAAGPSLVAPLDNTYRTAVNAVTRTPEYKFVQAGGFDGRVTAAQNYVDEVAAASPGGLIRAADVKRVESNLSRQVRELQKSAQMSGNDGALGAADAIESIRDAFMDSVARNSHGMMTLGARRVPVRDAIAAANHGYRTYVQMRRAGSRLGNVDGVPTPAQWVNAVQATDRSVGNTAFSERRAHNQDLAEAAKRVLPSKYNESGTAPRGSLMALAHGLAHGKLGTGEVAGLALTAGVYTTPGQYILRNLVQYGAPGVLGGAAGRAAAPVTRALGAAAREGGQALTYAAGTPEGEAAIDDARGVRNPALRVFSVGGVNAATPESAGRAYVSGGVKASDAGAALSRMTAPEKARFQQGFAGEITRRILGASDPREAMTVVGKNPQIQEALRTALGPNRAAQLETTIRLEGLTSLAPHMQDPGIAKALGISGPVADERAAVALAIRRGGELSGKTFSPESVERAAALVTSRDDAQYAKGLKQIANSPMLDALRRYDEHIVASKLRQRSFYTTSTAPQAGVVPPAPVEPGPKTAEGSAAVQADQAIERQRAEQRLRNAEARTSGAKVQPITQGAEGPPIQGSLAGRPGPQPVQATPTSAPRPAAPPPPVPGMTPVFSKKTGKWYVRGPQGQYLEYQGDGMGSR